MNYTITNHNHQRTRIYQMNKNIEIKPLSELEIGLLQEVKEVIGSNIHQMCAIVGREAKGLSWPYLEYHLYSQCVAAVVFGLINAELNLDITVQDGQVTRITNKVKQAVMDIVLADLKENNQL